MTDCTVFLQQYNVHCIPGLKRSALSGHQNPFLQGKILLLSFALFLVAQEIFQGVLTLQFIQEKK